MGLTATYAQNNPFKIDDGLYKMYTEAEQQIGKSKVPRLCEEMNREAIKKRDKKAQCLAYVVPLKHYIKIKDEKNISESAAKLRTISKKNGYMQYYYYAYRMEVHYLFTQNRLMAALNKAETMKSEAFKDNNAMGIYYSVRFIGDIHFTRQNFRLSLKYYQEALDIILNRIPEQDPGAMYVSIANIYYRTNKYDKAMSYFDKAIKNSKQPQQLLKSLTGKCMICFFKNDIENFNKAFKLYRKVKGNKEYPMLSQHFLRTELYKNILDGKYEIALRQADSLRTVVYRLEAIKQIYLRQNDFERAYYSSLLIHKYHDSINNMMMQHNIEEISAIINNDKLKWENVQLTITNNRLEQQRIQQELAIKNKEVSIFAATLKNKELENRKAKMEASLLKAEQEKYKALEERQKIEHDHHLKDMRMKTLIMVCVLVIMMLLSLYLINRHRQRKRTIRMLEEKNAELTKARNEAENANRIKTKFIQNMSHEIRTPLNAIVGFTNLLTQPGLELSEEEKKQFSETISTNSELLTTLVNDILQTSELESGTYTPNIASHSCNKICGSAINTVMHRKPQGVRLYFTSDAADDYTIDTDRQRVEQVLINFLTNAEKYTEQGEIHLHCSLSETPGQVTFSVTDTGTGIPADQAETIFERFKKLDSFKQGTGLGLNICRMIAGKLNGEVKLDTSYTGGSRFLLILPAQSPSTA